MKKSDIKYFQSTKSFAKNIDRTYKIIRSLIANIHSTKTLLDLTVRKREMSAYDKKMVRLLTVPKKDIDQIFEMGFINLFSHFEFFMYDFLKDLFLKFPKSFNSEISYNEIRDIPSVKKINEYIIDATAISKSYDIKFWDDFLKNNYSINYFNDDKELEKFLMLNELRNIFMHSGGKTNTKFSKKMKSFIKTPVPINEKVGLNRERYFLILYGNLKKLSKF